MDKRFQDTLKRLRTRMRRFRSGRDPLEPEHPTRIDPDVVALIEKLRRIKKAG